MEKLISMTAFVLEQAEQHGIDAHETALNSYNYANFLTQPLTLGMFVSTDLEGNVLKKPNKDNFGIWQGEFEKRLKEFEESQSRVLFEGFEWNNDELTNDGVLFWVGKFDGNETIENCIGSNLTLTQNAINQIK